MQAEHWTRQFSKGLLNPQQDLPQSISGEKRYGVYRNNVTVSLITALGNNFPAIKNLLGETYFDGFARQFVQSNPPQSRLMFEYGNGFPSALAAESDLLQFPYLRDVATLEIFWREAYHEEDSACISAEDLVRIPEDELGDLMFTPHPALRMMSSEFAAGSILKANRGLGVAVTNWSRSEPVMITRPRYDVLITTLSVPQFAFISALQRGETLSTAAEFGFNIDESFEVAVGLAIILQSGAFASREGKAL